MDITEDIDLEDLESRLYSQIYHSSETYEESSENVISHNLPADKFRRKYRYFESPNILNLTQSYTSFVNTDEVASSSTSIGDVYSTIAQNPISPRSNSDHNQRFQNNITVNQYSIPVVFSNSPRYVSPWYQHKVDNVKICKKKKPKRSKMTIKKRIKPVVKPNTVTIYLSDSDDCVTVEEDKNSNEAEELSTKFPKETNEKDSDKLLELDDDVIFIPPPPVEVIIVESDEKSPKSKENTKHSKPLSSENSHKSEENVELIATSECSLSNDFLETASVEKNSNFNFGLHGSDFNNGPTEVTKVVKPTEYCETESSCSTNDHCRDFCNTVNTIVFDEVDFPKDDIFSEKNLESFSSFITPKRVSSKSKEMVGTKKLNKIVNELIDISSDTSSSESDYESSKNRKTDNLPNLSPMVPYFDAKGNKYASNFFKENDSENISQEELLTNKSEAMRKINEKSADLKKKKEFKKLSCKKKKRFLETESSKILTTDKDCVDEINTPISKLKKKKKKREHSISTLMENNSSKEKSIDKSNDKLDPIALEKDNDLFSFNLEKSKKKKKKITSLNNTSDCNVEDLNSSPQNMSNVTEEIPKQTITNEEENMSEKPKVKRNALTLKNNGYVDENVEGISSTAKNASMDHILCPDRDNQHFENLDSIQESDEVSNLEKSKKKRRKRDNTSETSTVEVLETSNTTEGILADSLDAEMNKSTEEVDRSTTESSEKLKKKKERESLAEKIVEVNAGTSEILPMENDTDNEITADTIKQSTNNKETEISKELLEKDNVDKSKKKRKKRDSRGDSARENASDYNNSSILLNENDLIIQEFTETPNEPTTDILSIQSNTNVDKLLPVSDSEEIQEKIENDSEIIVLDESSNDLSLVSSESDFENLDNIGGDINLNLFEKDKNIPTTSNNQGDHQKIIKRIRLPLENVENFDVAAIQSQQSDDPEKWLISFRDRATYLNQGGRRGPRCNRCRHFGHIGLRCPDKPRPLSCSLCGKPDHQEPRCPNKMCTQCGNRGNYSTTYCYKCFKFRHSVCRLCKMRGHTENYCPDLWRRYHLTTDQGPMQYGVPMNISRSQQWCSGCAKQGHLEHECNYFRQFPPTTPFVINYEDNLDHNRQIASQKKNISKSPPPTDSTTPRQDVNHEIPSLLNLPLNLNLTSSNVTIQVSNDIQNQQDINRNKEIIFQMKLNFDNAQSSYSETQDIDLYNINKIKELIMSKPQHVVTSFLQKQLDDLHSSNIDPRMIKRKMFRFDKLTEDKRDLPDKLLREKDFWYRTLNMFVFGVHKYKDGDMHLKYLQRCLSQAKDTRLNEHKRRALFSSYSYIFGCNKHLNMNYYKVVRLLIRKYYSNKNVVQ